MTFSLKHHLIFRQTTGQETGARPSPNRGDRPSSPAGEIGAPIRQRHSTEPTNHPLKFAEDLPGQEPRMASPRVLYVVN
eukprot:5284570-Amphidinium_carterae.1